MMKFLFAYVIFVVLVIIIGILFEVGKAVAILKYIFS